MTDEHRSFLKYLVLMNSPAAIARNLLAARFSISRPDAEALMLEYCEEVGPSPEQLVAMQRNVRLKWWATGAAGVSLLVAVLVAKEVVLVGLAFCVVATYFDLKRA